MLVRRIARPLVAGSFLAEGWDAVRSPAAHVDRFEAAWLRLGRRVDLPPVPSRRSMTTLVRAHGAAMVGAAGLLALGAAPRTNALVLAALMLPVVASETPELGRRGSGRRGSDVTKDRLLATGTMLGAALLAAVDTQGRPDMAWRVQQARAERAAARTSSTD
ncbi:DoxX family protein [Actinotalea sp.]|uniref:DoxX family protein n=1 Tax=Actinotalea sp. TaxID=1872145 RepID=UPI003568B6E6